MAQFPVPGTQDVDYITAARQAAYKIWTGISELKSLQREWNALDYGTTLADGEGVNAGVLAVDVGAVVFATADAMEVVLNAGHATNIAKIL